MSYNSSLFSILISHRFDLFIVSKFSWMSYVRIFFFGLTFSLTDASTYSLVSSMHEILASISYILLLKLTSLVPVWISKYFISRFLSFCVFFIASNYISSSWTVLFVSFNCLFVFLWLYFSNLFISTSCLFLFSWFSLRDLFILSSCLFVFYWISLKDLFTSCLRKSIFFIQWILFPQLDLSILSQELLQTHSKNWFTNTLDVSLLNQFDNKN